MPGRSRSKPVAGWMKRCLSASAVSTSGSRSGAKTAPIFQPWEKHFTVVQWDRRGVGKTFGHNRQKGHGEMSLERMVLDGIEMAEWLRKRLQKDKLILLGHSMGSIVGVAMAKR